MIFNMWSVKLILFDDFGDGGSSSATTNRNSLVILCGIKDGSKRRMKKRRIGE